MPSPKTATTQWTLRPLDHTDRCISCGHDMKVYTPRVFTLCHRCAWRNLTRAVEAY